MAATSMLDTSRMMAPTSGAMYSMSAGMPMIGPRDAARTLRWAVSRACLASSSVTTPSAFRSVWPERPAMAME